ncbi:MAG: hypothetical protein K6A93_07095 [Bacteroidaceae bacterium]|nr:hypothetical protein [Bacteroidaceae bacterium]
MKRNMLLWATFLIVVSPLLFTNCSNDPEMDAVPPVFKEVVINPTTVQAGKSVNATLKIQSMGKSWYKVKYSWMLANYATDPVYSIKGEGSSLEMKEPTFTIPIPSEAPTGRYTLRITQITVEASTLFGNGSPFGASSIESNSANLTVTE